jgi:hypothetical protein
MGSVKCVGGTVVGEQDPSAGAPCLVSAAHSRAARAAQRTRSWRRAQTPHDRSAGASVARSCGPASLHVYPREQRSTSHRSLKAAARLRTVL